MEKYVINGGRKLSGKLRVSSAKNSVLPMLAGAILTDERVVIKDCPKILDVFSMIKILNVLGVKTEFCGNDLVVDSKNINDYVISASLGKELRSSIFMMGALLSRMKRAELSHPGGCDIGARPVDIHLNALKELGVIILEENGEIKCYAEKMRGRVIHFNFPSVGATENVMLASVLAEGKTEIHNPAKEPEIVDLMNFLNSMGGKVYGAGTSTILIEGVKKLSGTTYTPIPDRIEAGTFLLSAVITGGEIELSNCNAKNIWSLIHKLCDNTCKVTIKNDIIYVKSGNERKSFSFSTGPFPYFSTDLQAQTMALLSVSKGESQVTENIFEFRYRHVDELIKMGADIKVKGRTAYIKGVERLNGAQVLAEDLRGGASLVLAGLNASGTTVVENVRHIKRGYTEMDEKLRFLGADIKTIYD
ncbi:MAG: UDP-N-acetylglucosamine 1-carboxyvinyltransferase [Clostridia bacterium]|nr:UDP-N-acetylglucosamine 1-carboxyvinyltransferase [Clostridia bacterium]